MIKVAIITALSLLAVACSSTADPVSSGTTTVPTRVTTVPATSVSATTELPTSSRGEPSRDSIAASIGGDPVTGPMLPTSSSPNRPTTTTVAPTTTVPRDVRFCPYPRDEGWHHVVALPGDIIGDGTPIYVTTGSRIEFTGDEGRFELCVGLTPPLRLEFDTFALVPSVIGTVDLGGGTDTILVKTIGGASTSRIRLFAVVAGSLQEVLVEGDPELWIVVNGSVTHGHGLSCRSVGKNDTQRLIHRTAAIQDPNVEDHDDSVWDRSVVEYRREGAVLVETSRTTDTIRFGDWDDAALWWQLSGCPNVPRQT